MKRITDLEKFALDDIWRPYQNMAGYNTRLESIPVSLETTADFLMNNTEWSRCVLKRIADIGVVFPSYINHPIVDVIQRATESQSSDRGKQP